MDSAIAARPTPSISFNNVESSQMSGIGHDPATNTLAIKFNTGSMYHYDGVSPELYEQFLAAESKGKFFGANVKGKFGYRKIAAS